MDANAKFFFYFGLLGMMFFLSAGCYTGPYRHYDDCRTMDAAYSQNCDRYINDYGYRNQPYPYYYGNNPYYGVGNGGGGYKQNPFHVPSGRFHNFARPSKWRL
ncbi:hypothetical protein [Leptospira alstonii]|nr:hypothetical protein [Leptospira alstonii]